MTGLISTCESEEKLQILNPESRIILNGLLDVARSLEWKPLFMLTKHFLFICYEKNNYFL